MPQAYQMRKPADACQHFCLIREYRQLGAASTSSDRRPSVSGLLHHATALDGEWRLKCGRSGVEVDIPRWLSGRHLHSQLDKSRPRGLCRGPILDTDLTTTLMLPPDMMSLASTNWLFVGIFVSSRVAISCDPDTPRMIKPLRPELPLRDELGVSNGIVYKVKGE